MNRIKAAWAALRGRPVIANATIYGGVNLAPGQVGAVVTGCRFSPVVAEEEEFLGEQHGELT